MRPARCLRDFVQKNLHKLEGQDLKRLAQGPPGEVVCASLTTTRGRVVHQDGLPGAVEQRPSHLGVQHHGAV